MIEVNEYVRTKTGLIAQIKSINYENEIYKFDKDVYTNAFGFVTTTIYNNEMFQKMIKRHSKQLIDLVEVGDYVNGRKVKHIAMFEGFPDYPELIFVDETHLIPDDTCENDEIQTILTKESYMANCYKVGGEDE